MEQYIKHMPGTALVTALGSVGTKRGDALFPYMQETTMQDEHNVWNTTDVRRAIRRRIGEAFSAGYDLSQPLPNRMHILLARLDDPNADDATHCGQPLPDRSSP